MAVTLPALPAPNDANPVLIDYGTMQRPGTGAAAQRLNRPGSRYKIDLSFPPMPNKDTGRVFLSRLLRGKSQGIITEFPLLGMNQGAPGTPVVNGSAQSGMTINLRGLTAGYVIQEGYWLSISNGGRSYLHNVAAAVTASEAGLAAVQITPALRFPFADGAVVKLDQPVIDGFVVGEEWGWRMMLDHNLGLSVTIEEWG